MADAVTAQLLLGLAVATIGAYCLGFRAGSWVEYRWPRRRREHG